ncbi:MAG: DUF1684 domain-containing protein [Sediminibacterium sp.]|nr:MAG: DUF1684 domain-containing protein [Sediminibacterium sp.]
MNNRNDAKQPRNTKQEMKKILYTLLLLNFFFSANAQKINSYAKSVNEWHKARIADLKTPAGWLNLEGLYWLHKGTNSIGKKEGSDCRYNNASFPAELGSFIYEGDSVLWMNSANNTIKVNGVLVNGVKPVKVFYKDEQAITMSWSHYTWTIIKREDKIGVRFRNVEAKTLVHFKGIDRFPIDSIWRVKASMVAPSQNLLMITNVLGQTTATKTAGKLLFTINNKEYSLDVIDEGGPKFFIVFADETAGKTTYGAGRFIDIPKPDALGNTEIDFNLAYNPPCAFTAFATCPLPPPQNRLKLAIPAGEKNYGNH